MTAGSILVIDIGGISVKLTLLDNEQESITSNRFSTPTDMTPQQMMQHLDSCIADWEYDRVSIGYPGPVKQNRPWREPVNLGQGWMDFDYEAAFDCPVKMLNDAAMQALGSYRGGDMLFLGLGTGLGTALILSGQVVPLEAAHLPFRDDKTFEYLLGHAGLNDLGEEVWRRNLLDAIELFSYVFCTDYIVLGGGNSLKLDPDQLPENVHLGHNDHAFTGGFRLWQ